MKNNQAFTLIELLVVVLIIGILAAVALPQYQKAVEKSRATQAITLLKSVYNAAKAYQLANGEWPTTFEELSVDIPWTGTRNFFGLGHHMQGLSNQDWSIQLRKSYDPQVEGLVISRLTGPYAGAGFYIYSIPLYSYFPSDTIMCVEFHGTGLYHEFDKARGDYCAKIMKGTFRESSSNDNYFFLP